jgi:peptide deformylase
MPVLPLSILGDPVLRAKAERVGEVTDEHRQLIRDMYETMHANNGVGLAAPQVGVSLRIAVLGIPDKGDKVTHLTLVNPEWSNPRGAQIEDEGCLSIPGIFEETRRVAQIDVRAQDENGRPIEFTCEGLFARAVQHEVDHLNGTLFVDRLSVLRKQRLRKDLRALEEGRGVPSTSSESSSGSPKA